MSGFVSFVSAGPGDPELLTMKGAARLRDADKTHHTVTAMQGTAAYMSPESLRGNRCRCDRTVDVYAFGIMLWSMWTHVPPSPPFPLPRPPRRRTDPVDTVETVLRAACVATRRRISRRMSRRSSRRIRI